MKDFYKNSNVHKFISLWYTDFISTLEEHPGQYSLSIDALPTLHGYRIITQIKEVNTAHFAEAVCNNNDFYHYRMGIAIAWAKLHNIDLPFELRAFKMTDIRKIEPFNWIEYDDCICQVISKAKHNEFIIITVFNKTYSCYECFNILARKKLKVKNFIK